MNNDFRPDKHKVARSFDTAAPAYDDVAVLQRQTADELLDRLSLVKLEPQTILDLGAGTGRNLTLLQQRYPAAQLIALDIAPSMLCRAKQQFQQKQGLKRWLPKQPHPCYLIGDAEQLPLADNSIDLIYANLTLQWCELGGSFTEIQRVLKPEGLLMFTSLGPDTLKELRQSWAEVDSYPHVNLFFDMHDVGDAMAESGLIDTVLDIDNYTLNYPTAMEMMADLKTLGARNMNRGRRRGLTGQQAVKRVTEVYETFRRDGQLPATYEVIFGHAWKGQRPQQRQQDGSIAIPINQIDRAGR